MLIADSRAGVFPGGAGGRFSAYSSKLQNYNTVRKCRFTRPGDGL